MSVVRVVGLEPTLLAEPDFESGASTNSTTPARPIRAADRRRRSMPQMAAQSPAVTDPLIALCTRSRDCGSSAAALYGPPPDP